MNSKISIAPMMDWSDRHCRYFWRLITQCSTLYTEMVTTGAIINGEREKLLDFDKSEHPVILQIGGSSPKDLAESVRIAESWGYDGINLNCGCPSDRVQEGKIGAILMKDPNQVARCVEAMRTASPLPVSVKHRIGVDDQEDYPDMLNFVDIVSSAGCSDFTVHARKAWLEGLSPKENRTVPPLNYKYVHQLKRERPDLHITINGGIETLQQASEQLTHVDGVMLGRAAYHNPWVLLDVDHRFYARPQSSRSRFDVLSDFISYARENSHVRLHHMSRHILGLFHGQPGGKQFRRFISENACKKNAGVEVLEQALELMKNFNRSGDDILQMQ